MDYQNFAMAVTPFRDLYLVVFLASLVALYGYAGYDLITCASARVRAMNTLKIAVSGALALLAGMFVILAVL